jgi:hypothetical protein
MDQSPDATLKGSSTRSKHERKIPLSPLLAHTSTTDRCKSFICIHIAKQGGWGGRVFLKIGDSWRGWAIAKGKEIKYLGIPVPSRSSHFSFVQSVSLLALRDYMLTCMLPSAIVRQRSVRQSSRRRFRSESVSFQFVALAKADVRASSSIATWLAV